MGEGAVRIPAARWVIGLGRLYGGLLVLAACWTLVGVVVLRSPAALGVPLVLTTWAAAWGTLVRAFAAHRRSAWKLLLGLATVGGLGPVVSWLLGGALTVPGLSSALLSGVLLALLLHDDSREWVGGHQRRPPVVVQPGGGG